MVAGITARRVWLKLTEPVQNSVSVAGRVARSGPMTARERGVAGPED